jgi:hypothetical protein
MEGIAGSRVTLRALGLLWSSGTEYASKCG